MSEEKLYTLEEIHKMFARARKDRDQLEIVGEKDEWVAFRKLATDYAGSWIVRAFQKVDETRYREIDVEKALDYMGRFLAEKISKKRLVKEVLLKLSVDHFLDLLGRIKKKPKVTVGVQKGSCMYAYVRGKQGPPFPLQLTE